MEADNFKGKAINEPLKSGTDWERFRVVLTPEFEAMRLKAIDLLEPFAAEELNNISYGVKYFTIEGEDCNENDICDNDDCESQMFAKLKDENPESEIEVIYTNDDGDHENLNVCNICGRHLNTQLTWVRYESDYFTEETEESELTKEFIINSAFSLYCILSEIPSIDHDPSPWARNEYDNGRTLHVDLRTEFYEKLMKLTYSIVAELETSK